MDVNNILSIIISILGSSVITLVLSVLIFNPLQEKRQYIFNEKNEFMIQLLYLHKLFYILKKPNIP